MVPHEDPLAPPHNQVVKDTVQSLEKLDRALREKRGDDAVALAGEVQV